MTEILCSFPVDLPMGNLQLCKILDTVKVKFKNKEGRSVLTIFLLIFKCATHSKMVLWYENILYPLRMYAHTCIHC